jgi:hypothetical protein
MPSAEGLLALCQMFIDEEVAAEGGIEKVNRKKNSRFIILKITILPGVRRTRAEEVADAAVARCVEVTLEGSRVGKDKKAGKPASQRHRVTARTVR